MAKLTLNNVANGGPTGVTSINANSDLIEAAIENTLSRDGTSPNQMSADLDMNNNDLLNVGELNVDSITINGETIGEFSSTFQGLWDSGTEYVINDVVRDESGNLWIALRTTLNDTPVEGADWTLFMPGTTVADGTIGVVQTDGSFGWAEFDTVALASAYSPATAPDSIKVRGFASVSDNGDAIYAKVASEPSHAGKFSITLSDAVTVAWYELNSKDIYGEMFGLKFDSLTASATANSTAFQNAVDYLEDIGGGILHFVGGGDDYAYLNAVPIVPARVSLKGNDGYGTRFRKFGSTASTETTTLVPRWGVGAIGFPIAVIQLGHIGGTNWSGNCEHISVFGDNLDLATTTTVFGFFVSGMSSGRIHRCTAEFVQNGFFHGAGATIYSEVSECVTGNTLRGFYQEFATSTTYSNNYSNRARLEGYNISSWYGEIVGNACDNMGFDATASEIPLAYWFHSCRGGSAHGNGAEYGKGSLWKITSSNDFAFHGNIAMLQTSIYTGGSDVVALELGGNNINLKIYDNQAALSLEVGATPARHFNWKASASEFGEYTFTRNRFYSDWTSSGTDSGWTNTSGSLRTDYGTFTGTLTGVSGSVTGTFEWRCEGSIVFIDIPAIEGTSNTTSATITGVPVPICPRTGKTRSMYVFAKDNGSNFTGRALVQDNGVITLQVGMSSTGFTASGTKGLYASSITYGR